MQFCPWGIIKELCQKDEGNESAAVSDSQKNKCIPQISFCIATTAGYLVTAMATVVVLETDPSSSVNDGSVKALKIKRNGLRCIMCYTLTIANYF